MTATKPIPQLDSKILHGTRAYEIVHTNKFFDGQPVDRNTRMAFLMYNAWSALQKTSEFNWQDAMKNNVEFHASMVEFKYLLDDKSAPIQPNKQLKIDIGRGNECDVKELTLIQYADCFKDIAEFSDQLKLRLGKCQTNNNKTVKSKKSQYSSYKSTTSIRPLWYHNY